MPSRAATISFLPSLLIVLLRFIARPQFTPAFALCTFRFPLDLLGHPCAVVRFICLHQLLQFVSFSLTQIVSLSLVDHHKQQHGDVVGAVVMNRAVPAALSLSPSSKAGFTATSRSRHYGA